MKKVLIYGILIAVSLFVGSSLVYRNNIKPINNPYTDGVPMVTGCFHEGSEGYGYPFVIYGRNCQCICRTANANIIYPGIIYNFSIYLVAGLGVGALVYLVKKQK